MKKRLFVFLTLISLLTVRLTAVEYGAVFGAGLDTSLVHPYIYESAAVQMKVNDMFKVDLGLRVLDDFFKEGDGPLFFFMPTINITVWHIYLGGGLCMSGKTNYEYDIIFQLRAGATFGNWEWGKGYGGMDVGLELSPTVVTVAQDEDTNAAGAAIGSIFLTLFNMFKMNIGVTWYVPF
jgi:hypothetical protein